MVCRILDLRPLTPNNYMWAGAKWPQRSRATPRDSI
jgi:hypothetical protein